MRSTLSTTTLERKFPLLAVEGDCIISKEADLTVAFRVRLPELFTITGAEYEAMHSTWVKALKVLPDYTVVHKQDWFMAERYTPQTGQAEQSFLARSYELHFNERPFLDHACYLFITQTTRERTRQQSNFTTLCRGSIVPKEARDGDLVAAFLDAVGQAESIINESGLFSVARLTGDEIVGTAERAGLLEQYLSLTHEGTATLEDMRLDPDRMYVGDKALCVHTLSDLDDLPQGVSTDARYERLSTDRADCRLSFAAPVGLLLSCDHIYNQYVMLDSHAETLQRFEARARNLYSLSRYSRQNQINKEWLDVYLNEAHSLGLRSVRCHCNVVAWSDDAEKLKRIKAEVGSQLALMECTPRHNTVDVPTLFWAGIPGNESDFPAEETFYTFLEQAVCFFNAETNYRDSSSPAGIKLVDRVSGRPLHVDLSDEPMRRGTISNLNRFVLGPSGSGKSFFVNHLVRSYYEQGTHIVLIDIGGSYRNLCEFINRRTGGQDGIYYAYTQDEPVSYNPFYTSDHLYDIEKRESIKTLILTLWKKDTEPPSRAEEVALSNAVNLYILEIQRRSDLDPSFDTFYEFVRDPYRDVLRGKGVREKDFDIDNFLTVLEPYYRGGEYDYLLNSKQNIDLQNKRFIVFELDNIKDHKILLPITVLVLMECFISKMRRLKGIRKALFCDEAWKALANDSMSQYFKYLYKTARKHLGEIVTISQELDDLVSSPIIKSSILDNSDTRILLDQRRYANKFDDVQSLLGLTDREVGQIMSINQSNDPARKYKEVWIGLGGVQSAVYGVEVSAAEYAVYTTQQREQMELFTLTDKLGGNIELAIKQLVENKKTNH